MKLIFLLFCTLCISFSHGQSTHAIAERIDWLTQSEQPYFTLNKADINKLPTIEYPCKDDETNDNWHIQDLNHDGLMDAIYSGPCKPYSQTGVFINQGEAFEKVSDHAGRLVYLKSSGQITKIGIFKESCCCDYYSGFAEITIDSEGTITENYLEFHFLTEISTAENWIVQNHKGIMRYAPIINDTPFNDDCTGETRTGNQILNSKEEIEVVVINSIEGWNLALYEPSQGHFILGWINMR